MATWRIQLVGGPLDGAEAEVRHPSHTLTFQPVITEPMPCHASLTPGAEVFQRRDRLGEVVRDQTGAILYDRKWRP